MGVLTASTPNNITVSFNGSGNLRFSGEGQSKVKLKLKWGDDPSYAGDAIGSFSIGNVTWKSPGKSGSSEFTVGPFDRESGDININYNSLNAPIKKSDTRVCFIDNDGSDCNADFTIEGTTPVSYNAMTNSLYVNSKDYVEVTQGTNINVVAVATNADSGNLRDKKEKVDYGGISTTLELDTTDMDATNNGKSYKFKFTSYQFLSDQTLEQEVEAVLYPQPEVVSVSVEPESAQSGETMKLKWNCSGITNGNASRTVSNIAGGLTSATGLDRNSSATFTAGTGGVYTVTITATNGMGVSVTSEPVTFTVYDETPNDFEWDDKLDSAPPGSNQESNTITINGFGPTSYINSNLPIKSNYPVQVMVNGDGIWRNVEQI